MSARTKWPTEVPMLVGRNIELTGYFGVEKGCGCLMFWCDKTFGGDALLHAFPIKLGDALLKAHRQLGTTPLLNAGLPRFATCGHEPQFNRPLIARVWNRAMAILGYVVNNPECTRTGKLKPV